jgi:hypothetical protein
MQCAAGSVFQRNLLHLMNISAGFLMPGKKNKGFFGVSGDFATKNPSQLN